MKDPDEGLAERLGLRRIERRGFVKRNFPKSHATFKKIRGGERPPRSEISHAAVHDDANPELNRPKAGEHETPESLRQKEADAKAKAEKARNEANDPKSNRMAAFAALGITAAVATALIGVALADFVASNGAVLNFSDIKPNSSAVSWIPGFNPTKLDITWSVQSSPGISSDVTINEGDTIDISGTGVDLIDGKTFTVNKIIGTNVFEIDVGKDTSKVTSSSGTGTVHTTFETNFSANVDSAAAAAGNAVDSGAGAFLSGLLPVLLPILIFGALGLVLYMIFSSLSAK